MKVQVKVKAQAQVKPMICHKAPNQGSEHKLVPGINGGYRKTVMWRKGKRNGGRGTMRVTSPHGTLPLPHGKIVHRRAELATTQMAAPMITQDEASANVHHAILKHAPCLHLLHGAFINAQLLQTRINNRTFADSGIARRGWHWENPPLPPVSFLFFLFSR